RIATSLPLSLPLSLSSPASPPPSHLLSFPTRRSSDLPCIRRQTPSGHHSIRKCFRYGCVPPAWPLAHRSVSPSPAALYRLLLLYYPVSNKPVGCCQPYLPQ